MPSTAVMFRATEAFIEARSIKGLSQAELGELAGFGQASVSRRESGQAMTMRTAQRLAGALGLSLEKAKNRGLIEVVRNKRRGARNARATARAATRVRARV